MTDSTVAATEPPKLQYKVSGYVARTLLPQLSREYGGRRQSLQNRLGRIRPVDRGLRHDTASGFLGLIQLFDVVLPHLCRIVPYQEIPGSEFYCSYGCQDPLVLGGWTRDWTEWF
jgi:hypothetical protein